MALLARVVGVKDERGEHERSLVGHAAGARAGERRRVTRRTVGVRGGGWRPRGDEVAEVVRLSSHWA